MPFIRNLTLSANYGFPSFPVEPGQQIWLTPGTYTFKVPHYRHLDVEMWGGGGAAGSTATWTDAYGNPGGDSTITNGSGKLLLTAGGGKPGQGAYSNRWHRGHYDGVGGNGGVATGGDTNNNGQAGANGRAGAPGKGGNAGLPKTGSAYTSGTGGTGNAGWGNFPGGGGAGRDYGGGGGKFSWDTGGGGGGAYCAKSYSRAKGPRIYDTLTVRVGAGGLPVGDGGGDGGHGANGKVVITWY